MVFFLRSLALLTLLSASAAAQEFPTTPVNRPLKYEVVVLTFSEANCPYCRDAAPTWDLLRKEGVTVINYDVEKDRGYFQSSKVEVVPTTIVCAKAEGSIFHREMLRVGGSRPLPEYQAMIKRARERIGAGIDPWPADVKEPWPLKAAALSP